MAKSKVHRLPSTAAVSLIFGEVTMKIRAFFLVLQCVCSAPRPRRFLKWRSACSSTRTWPIYNILRATRRLSAILDSRDGTMKVKLFSSSLLLMPDQVSRRIQFRARWLKDYLNLLDQLLELGKSMSNKCRYHPPFRQAQEIRNTAAVQRLC